MATKGPLPDLVYVILDTDNFWCPTETDNNGKITGGTRIPEPALWPIRYPKGWAKNHKYKKKYKKQATWRAIRPETLGRVLAERAITKKRMIEIIDKHNLDVW